MKEFREFAMQGNVVDIAVGVVMGAMLGSVVWFAVLGFGAHLLAPVLRSPRAWRAIDAGIAVVMLLVAAGTLPLFILAHHALYSIGL